MAGCRCGETRDEAVPDQRAVPRIATGAAGTGEARGSLPVPVSRAARGRPPPAGASMAGCKNCRPRGPGQIVRATRSSSDGRAPAGPRAPRPSSADRPSRQASSASGLGRSARSMRRRRGATAVDGAGPGPGAGRRRHRADPTLAASSKARRSTPLTSLPATRPSVDGYFAYSVPSSWSQSSGVHRRRRRPRLLRAVGLGGGASRGPGHPPGPGKPRQHRSRPSANLSRRRTTSVRPPLPRSRGRRWRTATP